MSLGSFVRHVLGPFEKTICSWYRAIFINLERCTEQLEKHIPPNSNVIDVGGGDGAVINFLLRARPDITVSMLDLRSSIGMFLDDDVRSRVTLYAGTSLSDFKMRTQATADVLLVSDVVHHVAVGQRELFLAECGDLVAPSGLLIIKDIEPSGFVAWLSRFVDRYVTGDRHVTLISSEQLRQMVEADGRLEFLQPLLDEREAPNYAVAFQKKP